MGTFIPERIPITFDHLQKLQIEDKRLGDGSIRFINEKIGLSKHYHCQLLIDSTDFERVLDLLGEFSGVESDCVDLVGRLGAIVTLSLIYAGV